MSWCHSFSGPQTKLMLSIGLLQSVCFGFLLNEACSKAEDVVFVIQISLKHQ